eukprot:NODE_972_length_697_cov_221.522648_g963_i0.p1 GENE.NODE_972_length_697_cov_221.522648_g963_i0~~NODE_972_length_697_cov_221.522648_g963_i0.p1  ORF type:complete len:207 (-),score=22.06 NODE_972_length_697_cov_221.522648_g963_i0:75-632(-)
MEQPKDHKYSFKTVAGQGNPAMLHVNGKWQQGTAQLMIRVYRPSPPEPFTLNQFHTDWISYQCYVNSLYIRGYVDVARNVSNHKVGVFAYSGYGGKMYGIRTVESGYSVNWTMMAQAGITSAVCGYGVSDVAPTVHQLHAGGGATLICGAINGMNETNFMNRYNTCDGVMQFNRGHIDPGFYVQK